MLKFNLISKECLQIVFIRKKMWKWLTLKILIDSIIKNNATLRWFDNHNSIKKFVNLVIKIN